MPHLGGYQYAMGLAEGRYRCFMRVRLLSPMISGCFTRAYLDTSQKRFWQSMS